MNNFSVNKVIMMVVLVIAVTQSVHCEDNSVAGEFWIVYLYEKEKIMSRPYLYPDIPYF